MSNGKWSKVRYGDEFDEAAARQFFTSLNNKIPQVGIDIEAEVEGMRRVHEGRPTVTKPSIYEQYQIRQKLERLRNYGK